MWLARAVELLLELEADQDELSIASWRHYKQKEGLYYNHDTSPKDKSPAASEKYSSLNKAMA